jgi:hypothetical protein
MNEIETTKLPKERNIMARSIEELNPTAKSDDSSPEHFAGSEVPQNPTQIHSGRNSALMALFGKFILSTLVFVSMISLMFGYLWDFGASFGVFYIVFSLFAAFIVTYLSWLLYPES